MIKEFDRFTNYCFLVLRRFAMASNNFRLNVVLIQQYLAGQEKEQD